MVKQAEKSYMSSLAVIALVIGLQLGSALFLLPTQLAPYGSWSALSWFCSGIGALTLSLVFAVLSRCDQALGGPSVYVEKAFGSRAAFYTAWAYWVISWISAIPYLLLGVKAIREVIPWDISLMHEICIMAVILFSITYLNLKGALIAGRGEIVFAGLKIIPWLCIPVLLLLWYGTPKWVWPVGVTAYKGLSTTSIITFWGFVGFEASTTITNYIRNPERILPLALIAGTLCVIMVYFLNTWILMGVTPWSVLMHDSNPYGALFEDIFGPVGRALFSFLAAMTCVGTLNSWILACGQVVFAAVQSKTVPPLLRDHPAVARPTFGVWATFYAMLGSTFVIQLFDSEKTLGLLVELCCAVFIGVYFMCLIALLRLMQQKKVTPGIWIWPVIAIGGVFCVWSLWGISCILWLGAACIVISGWGVERLAR